jgi:SulP family sulfate permease
MKSIGYLTGELAQDFRSARLVPGLTSGLVAGMVEVLVAVSFAALIYKGELAGYVNYGIGFALIGALVTGVTVALLTSLPGTIAGGQEAPTAILAVMTVAIVASMPGDATGLEILATVVLAIGLTTVLCGILFLGLGYFNLGGLVRFLPYPVVGGFLAGTGWLLVTGSISMMTDISPSLSGLSILFQGEALMLWLPGLVFAIVLLVVLNRYNHQLLLPGLVLSAIALFFFVTRLAGFSIADIYDQGWLLGPFSEGNLFRAFQLSALTQANWQLILAQSGSMMIVFAISAMSLLLNSSGLELEAEQELDLNQELRAAGTGNFLAGILGGFLGFQQLSLSAMNQKLGAKTRLAGLFTAGVCLAALFVGTAIISLFPKFVLGGLLLFLGLIFLQEWVYKTWFKLPKTDYFVILLILVVIATVGFLEGVAVGILAAVILFVINYSQVDVIKHAFTTATYQSTITRQRFHRRILRRYGKQILILELQGYIFFGTANQLFEQIRTHVDNYAKTHLCYLLLDFSHVTGVDSSVVLSFRKMKQLIQKNNASIVLTGLSTEIGTFLQKSGVLELDEAVFQVLPDLDRGVEWCEEQLLDSTGALSREKGKTIHDQIKEVVGDTEVISRIIFYLERQDLPAGVHLIHQGDSPGSVYFLEHGLVTAQLESTDEEPRRLNSLSSENLVGEIGFYLGLKRNASVVTEIPTTLYCLTAAALKEMESEDPEAAALFHKFIAHIMAEKLSNLMSTVESLMR